MAHAGSHGENKVVETQVTTMVRAAEGYPDVLAAGMSSLATVAGVAGAYVEILVAEGPPPKNDWFRYRFTVSVDGGKLLRKRNGKPPPVALAKYTNSRADATADTYLLKEPQRADSPKQFSRECYPYGKGVPHTVKIGITEIEGMVERHLLPRAATHMVSVKILGGPKVGVPAATLPLQLTFPDSIEHGVLSSMAVSERVAAIGGWGWSQVGVGSIAGQVAGFGVKGCPPFEAQHARMNVAKGGQVYGAS